MNSRNDGGDGKQIPLSLRQAERGSSFARNDKSSDGAKFRAERWGAGWALAGAGAWGGGGGVSGFFFLFAAVGFVPGGGGGGGGGGFESGVARSLASAAQILQPLGA